MSIFHLFHLSLNHVKVEVILGFPPRPCSRHPDGALGGIAVALLGYVWGQKPYDIHFTIRNLQIVVGAVAEIVL